MGMFGQMTRSVQDFYPTRLLCKRFNVRPPEHVQQEPTTDETPVNRPLLLDAWQDKWQGSGNDPEVVSIGPSRVGINEQARSGEEAREAAGLQVEVPDATKNQRPSEDVFRAIFGDSSDEE